MKCLLIVTVLFFSSILNAQTISIVDGNFYRELIEAGVDLNNDKKIQVSEALSVDSLSFIGEAITEFGEIKYFKNLKHLTIKNNGWGGISDLDVSELTKLEYLDCSYNRLTNLDVSTLSSLNYLDCINNSSLTTVCVADKLVAESKFQKDEATSWADSNCLLALSSEQEVSDKKELINVYNLQGQKMPLNTVNMLLIVEYSDYSKEKVFIVK